MLPRAKVLFRSRTALAGDVAFLCKPNTPSELLAMVEHVLHDDACALANAIVAS